MWCYTSGISIILLTFYIMLNNAKTEPKWLQTIAISVTRVQCGALSTREEIVTGNSR